MATRQPNRPEGGRLARLASEFYVGALVLGAVILVAAVVAMVVAAAMQVNSWVMAVD